MVECISVLQGEHNAFRARSELKPSMAKAVETIMETSAPTFPFAIENKVKLLNACEKAG